MNRPTAYTAIVICLLINCALFLGRMWSQAVPALSMKDFAIFFGESVYIQLVLLMLVWGTTFIIFKLTGFSKQKAQLGARILGIASVFVSGVLLQFLALAHLSD